MAAAMSNENPHNTKLKRSRDPEVMAETTAANKDNADRYDLIKFRVVQDIQSEIVQWAKQRLVILTALTGIIGLFGGYFLVDNAIKSLVDEPVQTHLHRVDTALEEVNKALASSKLSTDAAN